MPKSIFRLFCIKGYIPLFESNIDLIFHVNIMMKYLFELINLVSELDTKSLILDFIENLIRKFKSNVFYFSMNKINISSKSYAKSLYLWNILFLGNGMDLKLWRKQKFGYQEQNPQYFEWNNYKNGTTSWKIWVLYYFDFM